MNNEEQEFGAVVDRLRALGSRPVDAAVATAHLTAMASVAPRVPWFVRIRRAVPNKLRLGAAVVAASLLGGSGLAFAGSLPGGMQNVAHDAFHALGISVPNGDEGSNGGQGNTAPTAATPKRTSTTRPRAASPTPPSSVANGGVPVGSAVAGTSSTFELTIQGPACVTGPDTPTAACGTTDTTGTTPTTESTTTTTSTPPTTAGGASSGATPASPSSTVPRNGNNGNGNGSGN